MATAFMLVLEEVGRLMESGPEQLFMTMLIDYGVRTCNMMSTNLNWKVSSNEPLTGRNGVHSNIVFSGVKSTKSKLRFTATV
eukprot:4903910-Heterocapsa_arctica.AAC.1